MATTMIYTQLNLQAKEFRVLALEPVDSEDAPSQLSGHLTIESLNVPPRYNALSYVWGDPPIPGDLRNTINLQRALLPTTSNLSSALRHLRTLSSTTSQTLWIDAVCINQQDVHERNSQVAMMRDIYASAETVTIWLGDGNEDTDELFSSIHILAAANANNAISEDVLQLARKCAGFFTDLDQRPWFRRMWIIQELALARSDPVVLCGTKSTPWSQFVAAWKFVAKGFFTEIGMVRHQPKESADTSTTRREKDEVADVGTKDSGVEVLGLIKIDVLDDMRRRMASNKGISFRKLCLISRTSLSSDPRDRVYALLGMLPKSNNDKDSTQLPVDYNKNTLEVYVDAMIYMFTAENGPYFLSGMSLPGVDAIAPAVPGIVATTGATTLPSWVVDFSAQTYEHYTQPAGTKFNPPTTMSASGAGSDCMNGKVLEDRRTLQVEGLHVDVIAEILFTPAEPESIFPFIEGIESKATRARELPCSFSPPSISAHMRKFRDKEPTWRALICNKSSTSGYDLAPDEYELLYKDFRARHAPGAKITSTLNDDSMLQFERHLRSHLSQAAFFITQNGFVGLCTRLARIGDHVAIWFGSPVPFVLRSLHSEGSEYLGRRTYGLIGASYVSGIMDGEMVDELYCEDLMDSTTFFVK